MNTFLPYEDFDKSAYCLDRCRLGKERIEVLTMLKTLYGESNSWSSHPALLMWNGYHESLVEYGLCICNEWIRRGYKDSCLGKIKQYAGIHVVSPIWLGCPAFHASHRQTLLFKKPDWYSQFGWSEEPKYLYVWPIDKSGLSDKVQEWLLEEPVPWERIQRMEQFWEEKYETL